MDSPPYAHVAVGIIVTIAISPDPTAADVRIIDSLNKPLFPVDCSLLRTHIVNLLFHQAHRLSGITLYQHLRSAVGCTLLGSVAMVQLKFTCQSLDRISSPELLNSAGTVISVNPEAEIKC